VRCENGWTMTADYVTTGQTNTCHFGGHDLTNFVILHSVSTPGQTIEIRDPDGDGIPNERRTVTADKIVTEQIEVQFKKIEEEKIDAEPTNAPYSSPAPQVQKR